MNKLGGFGPVYVINLARRTDRRDHMEKLFKDYEITNYTFIEAFDAQENIHQYIYNAERNNDKAAKKNRDCCLYVSS
jgi:GR25 family glycosyltransferase involved in LPS biosynthesis